MASYSSSTKPTPNLRVRPATFSDLSTIANVWNASFFDSHVIGELLHPQRHSYPGDVLRWFQHGVRARYWDWTHRFIVVVVTDGAGKETVVGAADWRRLGGAASEARRRQGGMTLAGWDPRRAIGLAVGAVNWLQEWLWPNRAAKGAPGAEFLETAELESKRFYQGRRAECWELYVCGVHPDWQGKGVGTLLVAWGIDNARRDEVSASVMTGPECGTFYTKAGYQEIISNGEMGIVCFWDPN